MTVQAQPQPPVRHEATHGPMDRAQRAVAALLVGVGEDPARQGLKDTPKRVAKALLAMTEGYRQDGGTLLNGALFDEPDVEAGAGGLVLVRDIDFAALSAATLLPFYGRAHVAYVPARGVVLGLSKLARLTKLCAKRLTSQEDLAAALLAELNAQLAPAGAAVVVCARHLSYTDDAPPAPRLSAAAVGCLAAPRGAAPRGAPSLDEVLALLGAPLRADDVLRLPPHGGAGAAGGGGGACRCEKAAPGRGCLGCAGAALAPSALRGLSASAGGLDSPRGPATPDPSEHDDTDGSEQGSEADGAAPLLLSLSLGTGAGAAPGGGGEAAAAAGPEAMEAAMALLLGEAGVDASAEPVAAAVRGYVLALLAATSGYHAPLPRRPRRRSGGASGGAAAGGGGCCAAPRSRACGEQLERGLRQQSAQQAQQQQEQQEQQQEQQQDQQQEPEQAQQMRLLACHEHVVPFVSQCEHHMLPFHGTAHITYLLPRGGGGGDDGCGGGDDDAVAAPLSDGEARQLVRAFTRRLQVQERITTQLAAAVDSLLAPAGVMVVVRAAHMCMVARGVENHAGSTATRAALGAYAADAALRCEALRAAAAADADARGGGGGGGGGACMPPAPGHAALLGAVAALLSAAASPVPAWALPLQGAAPPPAAEQTTQAPRRGAAAALPRAPPLLAAEAPGPSRRELGALAAAPEPRAHWLLQVLGVGALNVAGLWAVLALLRWSKDSGTPVTVLRLHAGLRVADGALQERLHFLRGMMAVEHGMFYATEEAIAALCAAPRGSELAYADLALEALPTTQARGAGAPPGPARVCARAGAQRSRPALPLGLACARPGAAAEHSAARRGAPRAQAGYALFKRHAAAEAAAAAAEEAGGVRGGAARPPGPAHRTPLQRLMGAAETQDVEEATPCLVVSLVLLARGRVDVAPGATRDAGSLRAALKQLCGRLGAGQLLAVELLLTPDRAGDFLSEAQLQQDYAFMTDLRTGARVAEALAQEEAEAAARDASGGGGRGRGAAAPAGGGALAAARGAQREQQQRPDRCLFMLLRGLSSRMLQRAPAAPARLTRRTMAATRPMCYNAGGLYPHGLKSLSPDTTVAKTLARLGSTFEVSPLPGDSAFVRPKSVFYELDGVRRRWDIIEAHSSVAVVIYHRGLDAFLLVRQFRPAVYAHRAREAAAAGAPPPDRSEGFTIELCAGLVDKAKPLDKIVAEEIHEEVGYDVPASSVRQVSAAVAAAGNNGATSSMFYAEASRRQHARARGRRPRVHGEAIDVLALPFDSVPALVTDAAVPKSTGLMFGLLWAHTGLLSGALPGRASLQGDALTLRSVLPA
ncbi:folE1 [Scenedesmus sp. PABB004]|nr:folE1 [Scenedesmus sp. PABB004]